MRLASLILLAFVAIVPLCYAMYEEQVGQLDWYRENIGNVKFAYFSSRTSSATDQRVMFVGTEAGVIAGLRVRHGDIAWRQVLPEGDTLDHLAFDPSARLLLSVSGACSVARLWNAADGTLQWDSASFIRAAPVLTHELEAKAALAGDVANEKENACSAVFVSAADRSAPSRVAVTLAGQVVLLDLATGAQLWSWSSKSQSQSLSAWQPVQVGFDFAADADHVTVLARNGDRSAVVALHVATGAVDRLIELPASVTSYMVRLSPVGLLAVLKADGVAVVRAGADLAKAPTQTLSSLGLKGSSESVELTFNAGQVLALRSKAASVPRTAVVLVSESASGAISVRQLGSAVDGDARVGVAQDGTGSPRSAQAGQVLVGVQQQQQFKLSVHLLRDPATAPQQLEWTVPDAPSDAPAAPAALSHVFAGVAQLAGGAEVTRVLVTRADHSVALAQDGKQFWRREEALASVVIAELVDPPSDSVFGSVEENTFPSFSQRLGPQLRSLVSLFRSTVGSVRRGAALTLRFVASKVKQLGIAQLDALPLASMAGEAESVLDRVAVGAASASASDDNQADFGFRKVLVLVTAAGKVFGLDSSTQQELWSRRLTALDDCPLQRCDWRLLSLRKAEVVLLITPKAGTRGSSSYVYTLDALSGRSRGSADPALLPYQVQEVIVLPATPHLLHAHLRPVVLVDSKQQVHVLPNSAEAKAAALQALPHLFFHTVDIVTGTLTGYSLVKSESAPSTSGSSVAATLSAFAAEIWRIAFPRSLETISAVAHPQRAQPITATNRVVDGGRAAWNKYINPNLIAVATVRSLPQYSATQTGPRPVSESVKTSDPSVNVYLIDSVTGTIIERSIQRYGGGPVNIVQSENVVVYHYFNHKTQQYEVTVLELYESPEFEQNGDSETRTFSSLTAPAPTMLQQAYTFGTGVKVLAVTRTRFGITSKLFLVGLTSNQIYGLPKAFVDPRRPIGDMKEADKEDGLVPYAMELPLDPAALISYNRTIANLRGIVTAPTLLESTSLVFAYGIDMFFVRTTPSKDFDLLSEEFNAPFLIATVSGVAIAIFLTKSMAARKQLAEAWR